MTAQQVKCHRHYMTVPFEACGVKSERVYVVRPEDIQLHSDPSKSERWFHIRFDDGGRVLMHPEHFLEQV